MWQDQAKPGFRAKSVNLHPRRDCVSNVARIPIPPHRLCTLPVHRRFFPTDKKELIIWALTQVGLSGIEPKSSSRKDEILPLNYKSINNRKII